MAAESWALDGLSLTSGNFALLGLNVDPPAERQMWASSVDSEYAVLVTQPNHENRTISMTVRVTPQASMDAALDQVGALVDKLRKASASTAGIGLAWTPANSSSSATFTVLTGEIKGLPISLGDQGYSWLLQRPIIDLEMTCKPYGLGTPTTLSAHTETTNPVLIFTETGLAGDIVGLGDLKLTDAQSIARWWVTWGVQCANYDSAATASLFYEAEGRTPLNGAAVATVSGASGGGSNNTISHTNLLTSYQAVMSTQASGGGAHLTHTGNFRVFARVRPFSGNGQTRIALEWNPGDATRQTRNTAVEIPGGNWRLIDLGLINLSLFESNRWEGRIVANCDTVPGTLGVDWFALVPVDEGYGEIEAVQIPQLPSAYTARDEFIATTAGGTLNTRVAPTGQTWTTSGATTDFSFVDTPTEAVSRATTSDSDIRRAVLSGSLTDIEVAVKVRFSAVGTPGVDSVFGRVFARYTSGINYAALYLTDGGGVAISTNGTVPASTRITVEKDVWYELRLACSGTRFVGWVIDTRAITTQAGILARIEGENATPTSGTVGFGDQNLAAAANTRYYRDFWAAAPTVDAVMYSGQSARITDNNVIRQEPGGNYTRPGRYNGSYLNIPPATLDGRTLRVIAIASRLYPTVDIDGGADDLTGQLTYTPRFLVAPH